MFDRTLHLRVCRAIARGGALALLAMSIAGACPPTEGDPPEPAQRTTAPEQPPADDLDRALDAGVLLFEFDWSRPETHGWSPPHGIPIDAYIPFGRQDPPPRWPIFITPGTTGASERPDDPPSIWVDAPAGILLTPAEDHADLPDQRPAHDSNQGLDDATRRLLDAIAGWEATRAGEALAALATDESLPLRVRSACALRLAERVEPGSARTARVLADVLRAWMQHH